MEKFECCGGIECSEKCIECQAYEQANRTKERAQKVLYALSIEDKIVSEAQNINDASKIQDIINGIYITGNAHLWGFTIKKLQQRIYEIKKLGKI